MIPQLIKLTIRGASGRRMVFLWIGLFSLSTFGQQFYFDQFSVSDGLAQSTVYKVIQDKNDIYWLGTQAGVASFDGVTFTNHSTTDGLAPNEVRAICEDQFGHIWFGHSGGGITRYDGVEFNAIEPTDILLNSTITSIFRDSYNDLWFTTAGAGVIRLLNPDAPLDQLVFEQFSGRELSDMIYGHHIDSDGRIYFVTDINVKYFNRDSSRFDNLMLKGVPKFNQTTSVLVDSKGRTWIGQYHGGLFRYNPKQDSTVMYDLVKAGLKSNWVSTLFEDNQGNIWVGTFEAGIARINQRNELEIYGSHNGMPGKKIWSIMQDREDNILIGTQENGLCVYKGDHFVSYFEDDGLINPQVWAILQKSDGTYWFGTNGGISILDKTIQGEPIRDFKRLQGERVGFLEEGDDGTIWIGTMNLGVSHYDKNGQFTFDYELNNSISQFQVTAMDLDSEGFLWVGTLDGLIYYDVKKKRWSKFTQEYGLRGNSISALYVDSKDRVWVGAQGNSITLIDGGEFIQLDLGFDFTPRCFIEDRDGHVWIGTGGHGLIRYDVGKSEIIGSYTVNEGLLGNLINQLNVDKENNIYVGTNKGLNIFVSDEERFYSFTSKSGFVGIETKSNASYLDLEGDLWFGTVLGVTRFHPSRNVYMAGEPSTYITGMQVNHEPVAMMDDMSFSYRQNSIIFEYRSVTLNPDEIQYQIMLEGVDMEWRPPDNQTRAIYPALPHGKYTFLVKAKNSAGIWNLDPASLQFVIRPPFYLTWYFLLASIFTVGLIIFSYIKIRERALKRENAILEAKVKNRTAIVVAQKEELAQKNKDITDSIRYAKRIQFAILPERSPFPNTLILFKPKDIVSGDFYWFTEVGDKEFYSAVDCTGHGVPGAFMSIIGHNSLTKIVREYGILEPGKILTELNKEVLETLHQRSDSGDVYDGMDLALVSYDRRTKLLEYSGAFNPLYLIRDGELLETKADRKSIGRSSFTSKQEFTNHQFEVQPGDAFYLFSDGYADQFGGELMKKFKYKNLKELILKIQVESMAEQRAILDHTIEQWRGDVEQLDDILVIGRRF